MLPSMVFCTATELTVTNQNITIGSKNVDWLRSFCFWPETEHRFGSVRIGSLNATECGFLHSNETIPNEPKHHYWVQRSGFGAFVSILDRIGVSFQFRPESGH